MCVFALRHLLFSYRGDRTRVLSFECKTDQANFTDWVSFYHLTLLVQLTLLKQPFNPIEATIGV